MLIDTHCHIYEEYYDNIPELIKELEEENIILLVNGVDPKSNKEVIELTRTYSNVYGTLGFHPSEVDNITNDDFIELEEQLRLNKILGIGEIGLDYYWRDDNKEKQIEILKNQLEIAEKNNYPVIIHNRESTEDILDILKDYKLKGIIHAYTKSFDLAKEFIKLGYKLGIGGVLTFKNTNLKEVVKELDIKDIVLETDSPYLTPEPKRGKQNKPKYLKYIAKELSKIKEIPYEKLKEILVENTLEIFDLTLKKW